MCSKVCFEFTSTMFQSGFKLATLKFFSQHGNLRGLKKSVSATFHISYFCEYRTQCVRAVVLVKMFLRYALLANNKLWQFKIRQQLQSVISQGYTFNNER